MVVDMALFTLGASQATEATTPIDAMPPTYLYIASAALKHLRNIANRECSEWLQSSESVIKASLDKYLERWSLEDESMKST
jgi:hypothetical protein